jgi:hypothetical protein
MNRAAINATILHLENKGSLPEHETLAELKQQFVARGVQNYNAFDEIFN